MHVVGKTDAKEDSESFSLLNVKYTHRVKPHLHGISSGFGDDSININILCHVLPYILNSSTQASIGICGLEALSWI